MSAKDLDTTGKNIHEERTAAMISTNQRGLENTGASAAEIQRHYDVGNEFYRLWLDEGMNYSCALWEGERKGDDLAQAQLRKLTYHIDSANASGKGAVLERRGRTTRPSSPTTRSSPSVHSSISLAPA